MILTELLGLRVEAGGTRVGYVADLRLELTGGTLATSRVQGLVVSPRPRASFLGFERTGVDAPALVARFQRWRHRGTFLVLWPDVEVVAPDRVLLRPGFRRYSPRLPA